MWDSKNKVDVREKRIKINNKYKVKMKTIKYNFDSKSSDGMCATFT